MDVMQVPSQHSLVSSVSSVSSPLSFLKPLCYCPYRFSFPETSRSSNRIAGPGLEVTYGLLMEQSFTQHSSSSVDRLFPYHAAQCLDGP